MSEDEKKGLMLAHAEGMDFTDLQKNEKIVKFVENLSAKDREKDPNSPGFKVVDFGVNDNLKPGQIMITGGEDVRDALAEVTTFVGDGGPARYIYEL